MKDASLLVTLGLHMKHFIVPALWLAFGAACYASSISIPNNGSSVYFQENPQNPGGAVRTLGQTFTLPSPGTDNTLTDFAFALTPWSQGSFDYRAYLFQWDGSKATSPALFTSAAQNGLQAASFSGLSIALTPGTTYIAFLTTEGVVNGGEYSNGFLFNNSGDVYLGGGAYQQTSPSSGGSSGAGSWTSAAWTPLSGDFQFTANFTEGSVSTSATPEPSSMVLIGLGSAAIFGLRRFRRSN